MTKEYITIQDAAEISGRSVQTIRRAVKSKKLFFKKQKTPQGFNYLIDKYSLCELYSIPLEQNAGEELKKAINEASNSEPTKQNENANEKNQSEKTIKRAEEIADEDKDIFASSKELQSLAKALEKMIEQHSEERQNFLRLINTLNEKIFILENQLNLLQAPKKKWYSLWK